MKIVYYENDGRYAYRAGKHGVAEEKPDQNA